MSLLIAFLTFVLVVTCVFLILLVLVQLPKKEAGAGLAFGAGATDALFGAGGGNALTKMTRYTATTFLLLALLLTYLNTGRHESRSRNLERALSEKSTVAVPPVTVPAAQPATTTPAAGTVQQPAASTASGPLQLNPTPAGETPALTVPQAATPANTPANPAPAQEQKAQP